MESYGKHRNNCEEERKHRANCEEERKRRMKRKYGKIVAAAMCAVTMLGNVSIVNADETFMESKTIWVVGDSLSSDHSDNIEGNEEPLTGWGNVLQNFVPDDVTIMNKARSGRSAQSYTRELVYTKEVMGRRGVKAGDYMIIQFGHNDEEKENPGLYSDPEGDSDTEGSFKWYLKTYYIEPNFEKGARTILASSVVRHDFENDKLKPQSHEPYAKAMKELAEEYQAQGKEVYFIDTFQITTDLYNQWGEEESKKMHAVTGKGDEAQLDTTHYGPKGAVCVAGVIARELKKLGLECCQNVKTAKAMDKNAADETRSSSDKFGWR